MPLEFTDMNSPPATAVSSDNQKVVRMRIINQPRLKINSNDFSKNENLQNGKQM